jgi:hypothetical protein
LQTGPQGWQGGEHGGPPGVNGTLARRKISTFEAYQ